MSLLTQASLIVTPNAVKASKLYSIIPSNGNGDMTVVRATTATRVNSAGIIESVASNVPRLNYDVAGGCPSILIEPQRTNQLTFCSDLSNSIWLKPNYALTSVDSIQGLTTTRITKNSTNNGLYNGTGARNVVYNLGTSTAAIKTLSCLIRKGNTNKVGFLINNVLVGALTLVTTDFNFTTKTFSNTSVGLTVSYENLTTDIYKFNLTFDDTGTSTSKAIWIAPIDNSNNTVTDAYLDIAYFQLEAGAYSTSYIFTTNAIVTRNTDVITRNNIYTNNLITSAGGTWFIELNNNILLTRDASGNGIWIGDNNTVSTIGNSFNIRHNGGTSRLSINKAVSGTLTGLYTTLTNTVKIAIDWNGTTADVFVNGVKVVTGTAFTSTNMEFLNSGVGGGCVPKYIKSMMLFPTPLTDSECIALTTL
jgi:hypothetical protein